MQIIRYAMLLVVVVFAKALYAGEPLVTQEGMPLRPESRSGLPFEEAMGQAKENTSF